MLAAHEDKRFASFITNQSGGSCSPGIRGKLLLGYILRFKTVVEVSADENRFLKLSVSALISLGEQVEPPGLMHEQRTVISPLRVPVCRAIRPRPPAIPSCSSTTTAEAISLTRSTSGKTAATLWSKNSASC